MKNCPLHRGSVLIETLVLLPVFLLLVFGVLDFARDDLPDMTGTAGSWDARFQSGTRCYLGFEAAYLGSAQSIDAIGLDQDATLLSNGVGARCA